MLVGDARVRRFVDVKLDLNAAKDADVETSRRRPDERRLKDTVRTNRRACAISELNRR
jgi:hypothetical protein